MQVAQRDLRNNGFSLIEVAIVLMLIALVAGLGLTTTHFFNGILVRSEIEKLKAACLYMQQCALSSNRQQSISFDSAHNSYSFDGKQELFSKGVRFGVLPSVKGPPATPSKYLTNPITFTNNCITFYPNGIIQSGTIYCIDTSNNYLYALSCGVSHTSYIRLYRYEDTWKLIG